MHVRMIGLENSICVLVPVAVDLYRRINDIVGDGLRCMAHDLMAKLIVIVCVSGNSNSACLMLKFLVFQNLATPPISADRRLQRLRASR
jgi:hypothetical protein